MSGYQQVPGYNPEQYGQPGYQQPYQQQAPPQYGYQPQPQYGVPQYPAAPSQPITVNLVNNQNQSAAPVVFLGRNYDSDIAPALIIFIIGWFCCFVWAAGFKFIRSPNPVAKALGIASVVLFFGAIIAIVVSVSVSVAAANAVVNTYNKGTSSATVSATSTFGQTIYVPSGSTSVYISSATSTWYGSYTSAWYSSYGSSSVDCYQTTVSSCPVSYSPYMELVAKCGSFGVAYDATPGTTIYCSGGNYLYLGPNVGSTLGNTGSLFVTVTFN